MSRRGQCRTYTWQVMSNGTSLEPIYACQVMSNNRGHFGQMIMCSSGQNLTINLMTTPFVMIDEGK